MFFKIIGDDMEITPGLKGKVMVVRTTTGFVYFGLVLEANEQFIRIRYMHNEKERIVMIEDIDSVDLYRHKPRGAG